jgi:hypothetical protein
VSPVPKPDAKQRRALKRVEEANAYLQVIDREHVDATNGLWEAMRKARASGATLGQIREATVLRVEVQGVDLGGLGPRYSRSRVQQITTGAQPAQKRGPREASKEGS